jgi:hypothetical protein
VTLNAPGVLYLGISGVPAPKGLPSLVTLIQESGWRVVVFSAPGGDAVRRPRRAGAADRAAGPLEAPDTGHRRADASADAVLAHPLTFNSVNKFAHGHADKFAVGPLCKMVDYLAPVIVVPHCRP